MAEPRTKQPDEIFCFSCGAAVKQLAEICVHCGVRLRPPSAAAISMGAYCPVCGIRADARAEICIHCGARLRPLSAGVEGKSKAVAVLLAAFLGAFTWLYTYRDDGTKFWIALALNVAGTLLLAATFGPTVVVAFGVVLGPGIWIWAIADAVSKSDKWYINYRRLESAGLRSSGVHQNTLAGGSASAPDVGDLANVPEGLPFRAGDVVTLVSGFALIVSGFLPWYSYDFGPFGSIDRTGWESPGAFWSVLAVIAAVSSVTAALIRLVARSSASRHFAEIHWPTIHLATAGVAAVSVLLKLLNSSDDLAVGFYVGIAAAGGLGAGSIVMLTDRYTAERT